MPSYGTIPELPHVAKVFCASECVRLSQDQASMRNVDSRINSLRFDCCVFLFYSFSAVTFATWGNSGIVPHEGTGISSPGTHEAILMWPRNDGELRWNIMSDWTCRCNRHRSVW